MKAHVAEFNVSLKRFRFLSIGVICVNGRSPVYYLSRSKKKNKLKKRRENKMEEILETP